MMTNDDDDQCKYETKFYHNNNDNDRIPAEEGVEVQQRSFVTTAMSADDVQLSNNMASADDLNVLKINGDDDLNNDPVQFQLNSELDQSEDCPSKSELKTCDEDTPEVEHDPHPEGQMPPRGEGESSSAMDDDSGGDLRETDHQMVGDSTAGVNHQMCQTPWENPHRQSLILLNLRRRLTEQEQVNKRLRLEKDSQLAEVTKTLLILEAQLRREQQHINKLLEEKDKKIAEQDKHIKALLVLNRKLAAGRKRNVAHDATTANNKKYHHAATTGVQESVAATKPQATKKSKRQHRKISWHNEVHVITDYDLHWTTTNVHWTPTKDPHGTAVAARDAVLPHRTDGDGEPSAGGQRFGDREEVVVHLRNGDDPECRNERRTGGESRSRTACGQRDSAELGKDVKEACDALNLALQESEDVVVQECESSAFQESGKDGVQESGKDGDQESGNVGVRESEDVFPTILDHRCLPYGKSPAEVRSNPGDRHRDASAPRQKDASAPRQKDASAPKQKDASAPRKKDTSSPGPEDSSTPPRPSEVAVVSARPPGDSGPPSSLGAYNRVMSNHRSVTKPKDVKYKKISRVKSRSLEELRGRLKQHHRTPGFHDGPILLESTEEL